MKANWELLLEVGHSLYPIPVYALGWAGYRWREPRHDVAWNPGDERFWFVASGGSFRRLHWKASGEGWWGSPPIIQGISIPSARRQYVLVTVTFGTDLGPGALEIGARQPLAGRNLHAGPSFYLGYFTRWGFR